MTTDQQATQIPAWASLIGLTGFAGVWWAAMAAAKRQQEEERARHRWADDGGPVYDDDIDVNTVLGGHVLFVPYRHGQLYLDLFTSDEVCLLRRLAKSLAECDCPLPPAALAALAEYEQRFGYIFQIPGALR